MAKQISLSKVLDPVLYRKVILLVLATYTWLHLPTSKVQETATVEAPVYECTLVIAT